MNKLSIISAAFLTVASIAVVSSCSDKRSTGLEYARNMYDPIGYGSDQPNKNFKNGQTAQTPPSGTLPIGFDRVVDEYPNTLEGYELAGKNLKNPLPVTKPTLEEGKTLYLNMCKHLSWFSRTGRWFYCKTGKISTTSFVFKRHIITWWRYERPYRRKDISYNYLWC